MPFPPASACQPHGSLVIARKLAGIFLTGRTAQPDSAGATAHLLKMQAASTNGLPLEPAETARTLQLPNEVSALGKTRATFASLTFRVGSTLTSWTGCLDDRLLVQRLVLPCQKRLLPETPAIDNDLGIQSLIRHPGCHLGNDAIGHHCITCVLD